MNQPQKASNIIHCRQCQYVGPGKTNSTTLFLILVAMFFASAYFLPVIIVALGYMVWIMTRPVKFACPQCKTLNVAKPAEITK